jgi:hypothetical protein
VTNNVKNINNKKETMLKVVLLINVEEVKFDYITVKNLIADIFKDEKINLQVEDFEYVEFEEDEEDIFINIMTCDYSDESENSYGIELTIENVESKKSLEFQISDNGKLTQKKFYKALGELTQLTKYSMEKKIFS